ncbi:zinc finger MYM-type protein 6-like [Octopus sinensis]|uniref:Zinc finger MYM-type protein 6-like n=1 Tax=Octopus sinensis TaxID=2607531 RepID=A0A6P7SSG9_9MOLL|nr:zinc finger MYM-type protein 6-like [Octopus sinensis]
MSKPNKKKTRQYAVEFLKFGFIPDEHDERKPFCLLCNQTMSNESMKAGRLEAHLKVRHPNNSNLDLEYFKSLKEKFKNRTKLTSLFHAKQAPHTRALEASYEISLLIAKHGKTHTIGEQLIKPAISKFLKTVLQKDDGDIRTMPLSNNTVSNRIDEMGQDVESQLIEKLKLRKFSLQMDESTIRDSEALLLTYVRYIDHEEFQEEMLFCESFETTTTANDIYIKIKHYLDANKIPKENLLAYAADGAPAMMGKNTGCLKMMKDENPNMLTVHCVIHQENLVAKNCPLFLTRFFKV